MPIPIFVRRKSSGLQGRSRRRAVVILLLAATLIGATASVPAQSADDADRPVGDVSLDELERYAVAYLEVRVQRARLDRQMGELIAQSTLTRERIQQIQEAGVDAVSENDAREYRRVVDSTEELQRRFQARMRAAVRQEDLSLDRFDEITRDLNTNPDLAERVQARLDGLLAGRADLLGLDLDESESGDD